MYKLRSRFFFNSEKGRLLLMKKGLRRQRLTGYAKKKWYLCRQEWKDTIFSLSNKNTQKEEAVCNTILTVTAIYTAQRGRNFPCLRGQSRWEALKTM